MHTVLSFFFALWRMSARRSRAKSRTKSKPKAKSLKSRIPVTPIKAKNIFPSQSKLSHISSQRPTSPSSGAIWEHPNRLSSIWHKNINSINPGMSMAGYTSLGGSMTPTPILLSRSSSQSVCAASISCTIPTSSPMLRTTRSASAASAPAIMKTTTVTKTDILHQRSMRQLHKPSSKIHDTWTTKHTNTIQGLWNKNVIKPSSNPKKQTIYREMIKSLNFGIFNVKHSIKNGKESDILSFYFRIQFESRFNKTCFLYLKYINDESKKIKKGVYTPQSDQVAAKHTQITVDLDYLDVNKIINKEGFDKSSLPSSILIVVFSFIEPQKMLALYDLRSWQSDWYLSHQHRFDEKQFNLSNLDWICNYFGLEPVHFKRLFKKLILFLESDDVDEYFRKLKFKYTFPSI